MSDPRVGQLWSKLWSDDDFELVLVLGPEEKWFTEGYERLVTTPGGNRVWNCYVITGEYRECQERLALLADGYKLEAKEPA